MVVGEGSVRRQGHSGGNDLRGREERIAFIKPYGVDDPDGYCVTKHRVNARQIQVALPPRRDRHILHRRQRHAHEKTQLPPLGLDEGLNHDVGRDVVGVGTCR